MQEAIKVLEHAEVVLMKKIKAMKDGKPKYAANERLHEVRDALACIKKQDQPDTLDKINSAKTA